MIRHLTRADYRVMPWANGRGQTVEMIRVDGPAGMLWRLSLASVVEDGPFSIFPGIARNLTVLTGPGFDLLGKGIRLRADPLVPVAFSGEAGLRAAGVTAASEDFNVMTARTLPSPQVWLQAPGAVAAGGTLCLLALEDGDGIAAHDLLIGDQAVTAAVPSLAVRLDVPFPA
ncbi:MAG: HutD family protein [Paracoccaceae bacterium]